MTTTFRADYTIHGALFNEGDYRHSHGGRSPRGRGSWGFSPLVPGTDDYLDRVFWHTGTFSEARRLAAEHFAKVGIKNIYICG
jgi:hypothetical protein